MFHQHLNSYVASPGSPSELSNHKRWQFLDLPSYPVFRLLCSKYDNKPTRRRILDLNPILQMCFKSIVLEIKFVVDMISTSIINYSVLPYLHPIFDVLCNQMRSQKLEMGGCFWGLGAEPPALENFAFLCKNNVILWLF